MCLSAEGAATCPDGKGWQKQTVDVNHDHMLCLCRACLCKLPLKSALLKGQSCNISEQESISSAEQLQSALAFVQLSSSLTVSIVQLLADINPPLQSHPGLARSLHLLHKSNL